MKIIKNAIFYLFLGIAILFTLISFCAEGSLWVLLGLWIFTALLWVVLIVGFKNQLEDYFLHNCKEKIAENEMPKKSRNYPTKQESTPEDFDECYHIALKCKIQKILGE